MSERSNWPAIVVLWCCGIGAAMQFAKVAAGFDALGQHYGLSLGGTGWLLSVVGTVGLLFGATAGLAVSRAKLRNVLCGALAVGALLAAAEAALPPLPLFVGLRLAEGVSHLVVVIVAPILMNGCSTARHRAVVMGLWGTFFGVAFSLTNLVAPALLRHGLASLLAAHAGWMAGLALLVAVLLPASAMATMPAAAPLTLRRFLAQHAQIYANRATALPGLLFLFHTLMFIALLTFVPRLLPESQRAALLFALPLCGVAGTFAAGLLAQYLVTPVRLTGLGFAAVGLAAFGVQASAGGAAAAACAILLLFVSGIVQGAVFTTVPYLNRDPGQQACAHGAVAQLGNLGATVGPPAIGASFAAHGPLGLAVPVALLAACGLVLALASSRRSAPLPLGAVPGE
jgi:predicted MFS family arabinose efflux permease